METETKFQDRLIGWLQNTGLAEFAAAVLEAAGPLNTLGAQAILMIEPLVSSPGTELAELANMLDDPEQLGSLVRRLRDQGGQA